MNKQRLVRLGVALVLAGPFLAACGAERSTEAFCEVYDEEKQAYIEGYGGQPGDDLAALGNAVGAMSAWVPMFDRFEKHAPEEIRADVAHIRDSLKQMFGEAGDSVSDPLGGLASGLFLGLMTADSWQRLEVFVEANCVTEEEHAARAAAAEAAKAEAEAAEEAAKVEEAENDARNVIEFLSPELAAEIDTTWLDESVQDFEWFQEDAESALAEAKDAFNDRDEFWDQYFCDYPDEAPWAYAVNKIDTLVGDAKGSAENFSDAYIEGDYLRQLVREGEAAVGDLGRRVPDSPMVNTLQNLLEKARARTNEIDELNAAAQAEVDAIVVKVEKYLPEAERIRAQGDAALGC